MTDKVTRHKELCNLLNLIYEQKNNDYGDSFHSSFIEYGPIMSCIRLGDKFNRFKSLAKGTNQAVKDESIKDTLLDLANYAIMTIIELEGEKYEQ